MQKVDNVDKFFSLLQDGVILCQLVEKISKDNTKYRKDAKPQTFHARENITHFLDSIKHLGVPAVSIFEADDLVARKNDKSVLTSLLQLSRIAAKKYNIEPPTMIKYELEIEEEQLKKEGKTEEKEDDEEEEKDTEKEEEKGAKKEEKEEEEDEEEEEEQPEKAKAKEPEQQTTQKKEEAPADKNKDTKEYQFLPYVAKKDNEIDQAVALALNKNKVDVDCKQVQIKNKKRRRDQKHKAEYVVNGHRVPVRMLQGVLHVRVQNEWINFVRFAQEQQGITDE
jgi:outer membrane biosynthesis protein TonB